MSDGIYDERILDDKTLEYEIWEDWTRAPGGDEFNMMTLFKKGTALEDESESDETLIGNTHDPYNLEMTPISNQILYQYY